jgi:hypothetical protein
MAIVETMIPVAAGPRANRERLQEQRDMLRAKYRTPVRIDGWEFHSGLMIVRWAIGAAPARPVAGRPATS